MKYIFNKKVPVYIFLYIMLAGILFSVTFIDIAEIERYNTLRFVIITFAAILLAKYFIYMFLSPWNEIVAANRIKILIRDYGDTKYNPKVSVIVPAWNEENGIITTIKALLKSSYKNMEILVIDNASEDNTSRNVHALIVSHGKKWKNRIKNKIDIIYRYEKNQGKGNALNNGLDIAKGDIILSIDADCYVPIKTVANFVKCFKDPNIMAAVGNVRIGNTDTIVGVVQYLEFLFSFYFKKAESLVNVIYIIGGAAGAFRREVFKKIGKYSSTNITEDIDLSVRIQKEGMRIAYVPDALVYTEGAVTLGDLMKQRLRWKRGRFETFSEHRNMFCSFDKKHNKILSWIVLPLAIIGDFHISLEIVFLSFLYIFSFMTGDFTLFISGIVVVCSMFLVQVVFDKHEENIFRFLLLAPIGWLLFYVSTFVEMNALYKALWGYFHKKELVWQKWKRKGVFTKN